MRAAAMLIPEWKTVLRRAWSVKFLGVAVLCEFVANVWPLLIGFDPPRWLTLAGGVFVVAGLIARFVLQPKMRCDADR